MNDKLTRRDVLRGLGGLALINPIGWGAEGPSVSGGSVSSGCPVSTIAAVANRAIPVSGVQAYAEKSITAGGTINFRVSSTLPYTLSVVRLGWNTEAPGDDWTLVSFPQAAAAQRTIHTGSYIHVERALPSNVAHSQLTLECWVRPFRAAWQGLISQHTYNTTCGYGLFLAGDGTPAIYFGDGGAFNRSWLHFGPAALRVQVWTHLAAVFQAGTARLYVNGALAGTWGGSAATVTPGPSPLRIGAYGDGSGTGNFLDGDIAMPVIYSRALTGAEISARAGTLPPVPATDPSVLGCWPLSEETGTVLADSSTCGRTGLIVNRGTWMIGGPGFDATAVPRFGYNPDSDPTRGHGLRLSSSDLYDCAWPVSRSYTLPNDVPPGVYVGRIIDANGGCTNVTFIVRRATARPAAPVLVLCATNTWQAYNVPFGLFSFYQNHPAGQPTYYTGIDMPWPQADPYLTYIGPDYSHLVRAERFLHVWLEQMGIDYDMISDHDLHLNPGVLFSYRALLIAGHSEYWSQQAWFAVRNYLSAGGHVIMASGNTMFWRVSYDTAAIECRKLPLSVGGRENASWGELFHEHDHKRGGLMREAGYPEWQVLGLESVGWRSGPFVPYVVTNAAHAFYQAPELVGLPNGAQIGTPAAIGHEWDVRLQNIPGSLTPPIPSEYTPVVLAEGRNASRFAYTADRFDYQGNWISGTNQVISEVIDWKWNNGGRIFAAGSIGAARALTTDRRFASLFRNALHHHGVIYRLNAMGIGQDGHFYDKSYDGTNWNPSFGGWDDFGAGFGNNPPTGVQWGPNSLAIMAITAAGSFYFKYWVGAGWSGWNDFGGTFQGRPAAVGWGRNRIDLFARGTDNHLYQKAWNGSAWSRWVDLGGGVASDPTAVNWEGNRLSVAVRGTNRSILYKSWVNGTWYPSEGFTDMGGTFEYAPTLLFWNGKMLNVMAVDAAGRLWNKWWDGTAWSPSLTGWQDLGIAPVGRVQIGMWGPNQFTVFGVGLDGQMKGKWWNGANGSWGPSLTEWQNLGGTFTGEPAVAHYRGHQISVTAVATNGHLMHRLWDGYVWSAWQDMGGTLRASPAIFRWIGS